LGAGVVVEVEPDLLDVEGLGRVDIADRDRNHFELEVHAASFGCEAVRRSIR
jgi:hypothetical protein